MDGWSPDAEAIQGSSSEGSLKDSDEDSPVPAQKGRKVLNCSDVHVCASNLLIIC